MDKLRLRFEKTGRAVWISHLDLMTTMQRAFSRAGYELQYSEGFNPHPLISILLPLSVGAGSVCELMDFRLRTEADLAELPSRLTAALPEGIRALEAYPSERKSAQLKWLEIEGRLEYDNGHPELSRLTDFFARDSLLIEKKTKRGIGQSDIRPAIREIAFAECGEGELRLRAVISAQEPTLNPDLLVSALRQLHPELAPDFARFTRLETYDADLLLYR
ncbi:MAG: DUF2344 domain-containing protein [Oscillospiraceae bacterium]|nr:DUF2344 domain-containing protein [Oscillospiraceae bacterium]